MGKTNLLHSLRAACRAHPPACAKHHASFCANRVRRSCRAAEVPSRVEGGCSHTGQGTCIPAGPCPPSSPSRSLYELRNGHQMTLITGRTYMNATVEFRCFLFWSQKKVVVQRENACRNCILSNMAQRASASAMAAGSDQHRCILARFSTSEVADYARGAICGSLLASPVPPQARTLALSRPQNSMQPVKVFAEAMSRTLAPKTGCM